MHPHKPSPSLAKADGGVGPTEPTHTPRRQAVANTSEPGPDSGRPLPSLGVPAASPKLLSTRKGIVFVQPARGSLNGTRTLFLIPVLTG